MRKKLVVGAFLVGSLSVQLFAGGESSGGGTTASSAAKVSKTRLISKQASKSAAHGGEVSGG
jgi:hypothetical protein